MPKEDEEWYNYDNNRMIDLNNPWFEHGDGGTSEFANILGIFSYIKSSGCASRQTSTHVVFISK